MRTHRYAELGVVDLCELLEGEGPSVKSRAEADIPERRIH
jgi:hypothetical protein